VAVADDGSFASVGLRWPPRLDIDDAVSIDTNREKRQFRGALACRARDPCGAASGNCCTVCARTALPTIVFHSVSICKIATLLVCFWQRESGHDRVKCVRRWWAMLRARSAGDIFASLPLLAIILIMTFCKRLDRELNSVSCRLQRRAMRSRSAQRFVRSKLCDQSPPLCLERARMSSLRVYWKNCIMEYIDNEKLKKQRTAHFQLLWRKGKAFLDER
jgi:hypothetical protein